MGLFFLLKGEFENEKIFKNCGYSFFSIVACIILANSQLFGSTVAYAVNSDSTDSSGSSDIESSDSSDSMDDGQEENTEQSNLQSEELVQDSTALEETIFGQSLEESFAMPTFSIMAVQPGNYSPDNWSSGYRIRTVDSADKRAELFNDFSYWMVRKFEIEIDTRHANDMNIIQLVNDATNSIANVSTRINSVKSTADYAKNLADHLGNTVIKNVETLAKNAQTKANAADGTAVYAKDLAVHLSTNVIKDVEKTALYAKDLADHLGSTVIKNVETTANSALSKANAADGTAVYAKNLADHLSGTVIKDVEKKADYAKDLADYLGAVVIKDVEKTALSAKTTADIASGNAIYAKNLADHLGGTVIKNVEAVANNAQTTNSTQQVQINALMASEILSTGTLSDFKKENAENLVFILGALKDSKTSGVNSFAEYFKVDLATREYSTYSENDGVFTKLFKGQITRIVNELRSLATTENTKIDNLITAVNRVGDPINNISSTFSNLHVDSEPMFIKLLKGLNRITETNIKNATNTLKTEMTAVGNKIKDYTTLLTTLNLSTLANATAINSSSTKNAENLTLINATLKGLKNYDDNSFKTYINGRFSDYFTVATDYESGINASDGIFTKVVKGQFTRLIAELNRQLTLSFTTTTNNIDSFKTYLREEFGLLNDWFSLMSEWMLKIYEKPSSVFQDTPFDYVRLQKMFDGISFGNVINEAGTNIWDVLKELIEAMGKVVEAVVGIVPDLIDKLIGLIIPENRNIFSDKMKEFTGKFDNKFSSVAAVTTEIKSVYSQPKNISSIRINIFGQDLQLIPDMFLSNFNWLRSILSAYLYLSTLITCYKRIVGSGDVIE